MSRVVSLAAMTAPSGDQFEIAARGYRAVVTECGATLRLLEHTGRPLLHGFGVDEMSGAARGQLLVPWPNRIRDGRYSFGGRDLQLGLTEPARQNASHGLARWAAWSLEEHGTSSVSLGYRLMAQSGYPWTVDLHVLYDLSADGLTVTQTATNLSDEAAPYASGAHPYLTAGGGPVDGWELTLPAGTRLLPDDRLLPVGEEDVAGTPYDFRVTRPVRDTRLDHAFGDLARDGDGVATTLVRDPSTGRGAALWVDRQHPWLMVFSADDGWDPPRQALAVEPMTAPPDAFRSGRDLLTLAPAGQDGDEVSVSWGIRALE
jgi:aldose 1-epimerase